jgi:hypothetical protein
VRGVKRVRLTTRDAQPLYAELGFVAEHDGIPTTMLRAQATAGDPSAAHRAP